MGPGWIRRAAERDFGLPNGWRVSGERRAEGDERVRCTRVLGGWDLTAVGLLQAVAYPAQQVRTPPALQPPICERRPMSTLHAEQTGERSADRLASSLALGLALQGENGAR